MCRRTFSNALQFLAIFLVNVRPQNALRSLTEELPVALGGVSLIELAAASESAISGPRSHPCW